MDYFMLVWLNTLVQPYHQQSTWNALHLNLSLLLSHHRALLTDLSECGTHSFAKQRNLRVSLLPAFD